MSDFEGKWGGVNYYIEDLAGCCGVSVVYDVVFHPKGRDNSNTHKLYDEFMEFLKSKTHEDKMWQQRDWATGERYGKPVLSDTWVPNKIIMSDRVFPEAKPKSIQAFCEYHDWIGGTVTKNPRHRGHNIRVWEYDVAGTVEDV